MQEGLPGSGAVLEAGEDVRALERLEEAARRSEVARKQFGRLRDVGIAAQQVIRIPEHAFVYMQSLVVVLELAYGLAKMPPSG